MGRDSISIRVFWEGNGDLIHEKEKEDEWYCVWKLFELWNENMDNNL